MNSKNNNVGMPGIKARNATTAAAGNHALDMPIWFPICSDMTCVEETLVTIIAVARESNKDGI